MPTVNITIRNNIHQVACDEGQEAQLKILASSLNKRIAKLSTAFAKTSDVLLLIMTALTIEDELSDLKKQQQQLSLNVDHTSNSNPDAVLIETIDSVSQYVENLIEKITKQ
jgi:cell division protein ZapA